MKIILVIGIIGVAILLLSVGVIFRKDHTFRSQHIHQNPRMNKDKIHCARTMDKEAVRKNKSKLDINKL